MVQNTSPIYSCHDQMKFSLTPCILTLNRQTESCKRHVYDLRVFPNLYHLGQGEVLKTNISNILFFLEHSIIATVQSFEDLIIQIRDHWLVKDQREKIKKVLDHCLKELPNRCFDAFYNYM